MSHTHDTVLVIGADKLTSITNWTDRNTCVLFGDDETMRRGTCMYLAHFGVYSARRANGLEILTDHVFRRGDVAWQYTASSAVARPILQLARKVLDNSSIASMTNLIQ